MNRVPATPRSSTARWLLIEFGLPFVGFWLVSAMGIVGVYAQCLNDNVQRATYNAKLGADLAVQDALDQVLACEHQARGSYEGKARWDIARQEVWDPCVAHEDAQVGAVSLHPEADVTEFHQRLAPVERLVRKNF